MKKILALVLVIALLASFSVAGISTSAVKNLLVVTDESPDGIFEGGYIPEIIEKVGLPHLSSWAGAPSYVSAAGDKDLGWVKDNVVCIDTETVKFGKQSIKLDPGSANNKGKSACLIASIMMYTTDLEEGKTYTYQGWIKTNKIMSMDTGAGLVMSSNFTDQNVNTDFPEIVSEFVTGTKDWMLLSITFTAPKASADTIISFGVRCWGTMAGTAWFDGLAVIEGDKPVKEFESIETTEKTDFAGGTTEPTKVPDPADPTKVPEPVADEPSAWAKDEVVKAVEAKLVPEHINSKFTSNITRSDFCDLIINMITTKTGKAIADVIAEYADKKDGITFPDTTSENVLAAAALGIVNGRSSGAFDPDASITRQEAAKMLTLAAKVLGADTTASDVEFADAADIFAWAKEFINYVNSIDVMKGTNTATPPNFSPTKNYTREQSILTVYRLFNAIGK